MAELFSELLKMSLIGSLFAVAVMAVRLVFRKAPKWIFVVLWGVVALRLLLPFSVESKVSLVPEKLASGQIVTQVRDAYIAPEKTPAENIPQPEPGYQEIVPTFGAELTPSIPSQTVPQTVPQQVTEEIPPKTLGETVFPVLGWVWAVGVALMLMYMAGSYFLLKGKMAVATLLQNNIWQCERADMPFVLGVFHPKVYLPYWITGKDMDYVIAHEQAHIARKDHWWKPLGFLLLSLHWFNPVIWVAYILLCRDIEVACDEKVIGPMDKEGIRAYSTALLNCSVHRRRIAACPLAFGETGVKERIRRVMNYKKPAFWIALIAVIACIIAVVCFCTNPLTKEPEPQVVDEAAESNQQPTESNNSEINEAPLYHKEEDGYYYVNLPISKQKIWVQKADEKYLDAIDPELLKKAEEKLTDIKTENADTSPLYLRVKDGKLCLSLEMIVKIESKVEGMSGCGYDHEHQFFDEPITKETVIEDTTVPPEGQEGNSVDLTAIEEFRAIMKSNQWYGRAWDCTFEKPEDINAYFFFYNGVGANEQATDEELAFIVDAFKKRNPNTDNVNYAYNYKRLPVEKINEGLAVLGVTLEDIQIPDRWVYNEKTDAYYFWVSDAFGVTGVDVTKVEKSEDGIMKAYWETEHYHLNTATGKFMHGAKMVMTLQEQPDGTYRVLSNVPQE